MVSGWITYGTLERTSVSSRPISQHKDRFFPEEQRSGNKRQRQEIEGKGGGKGRKGEEEEVFALEGQRIASG